MLRTPLPILLKTLDKNAGSVETALRRVEAAVVAYWNFRDTGPGYVQGVVERFVDEIDAALASDGQAAGEVEIACGQDSLESARKRSGN